MRYWRCIPQSQFRNVCCCKEKAWALLVIIILCVGVTEKRIGTQCAAVFGKRCDFYYFGLFCLWINPLPKSLEDWPVSATFQCDTICLIGSFCSWRKSHRTSCDPKMMTSPFCNIAVTSSRRKKWAWLGRCSHLTQNIAQRQFGEYAKLTCMPIFITLAWQFQYS